MAQIDGAKVRGLREEAGHIAQDFAASLGISPQYLSDIELGRRQLQKRPDLIRTIADQLGVPLDAIRIAEPVEASA